MPVAFDCECGSRWWSPPDVGCVSCGPGGSSTPDPVVWSVDRVPGTDWFLSAQLRDRNRFAEIVSLGISSFIDVAGGASYVWRPTQEEIVERGVRYIRIDGVEDTNVGLPDFAFDQVAAALVDAETMRQGALLFCAAGLKRSPHLLYGVLRSRGHDRDSAWATLATARPFVDAWHPYLNAAERWVARGALTRSVAKGWAKVGPGGSARR